MCGHNQGVFDRQSCRTVLSMGRTLHNVWPLILSDERHNTLDHK